ncbi:MAG: four helix bundle protein [Xenococcaceae cyanobacterium MO_188.B19]|nr:four helix bundle protein [Xenococcaceae cyanobacterium MO_188.B19]
MDKTEFKARTKKLAIRVIRLVSALPQDKVEAQVIGKQLCRCATSVGANYRAIAIVDWRFQILDSFRFTKRLVIDQLSKVIYFWRSLHPLEKRGTERSLFDNLKSSIINLKFQSLMAETNEIVAMLVSSLKTLRSKSKESRIYNSTQSSIL